MQDIERLANDREQFIIAEAMKIFQNKENNFPKLDMNLIDINFHASNNTTNNYHKKLGAWGEQYINFHLSKQKEEGKIHDFQLLNQFEGNFKESYNSHDFEITPINSKIKLYIDVKTTEKDSDYSVFISDKQWDRIFKHQENYIIYRVYEADLASLPEDNTMASFFEFTPFEYVLQVVQKRIQELCQKSYTHSTKMDVVKELL